MPEKQPIHTSTEDLLQVSQYIIFKVHDSRLSIRIVGKYVTPTSVNTGVNFVK